MGRDIATLVGEIDAVRAELGATAQQAEDERTAPGALVELMRGLRVPMVKAPESVGGDELCPPDQVRYFSALAYANPTAGWIGFVHAGATGMIGAGLPEAGVEEVFRSGVPFCAGVAAASGTCRWVGGGWLLDGHWRFASGVRHAEFVMLGARAAEVEPDGVPGFRRLVVPISAVTLKDDWHVMSQKGTGSVDVLVSDVFVPDHMTLRQGTDMPRGGPLHSGLPGIVYVAGENFGFTHGVATRFLDELAELAVNTSRGSEGTLADRGAFRYEFGRAVLRVEAARTLVVSALTEAWRTCLEDGAVSPRQATFVAGALAAGTADAVEAVTHLFPFAGGSALRESSVLQRCLRDAQGSQQHILASSISYEKVAAAFLEKVASSQRRPHSGV
ncbi:acyl-CoA dehydrogenase family protein [Parafrankia elaeagni]|uniref:hypothetical protein n=1 Tax=Parafrankia elaeagni TaxID=222534 RepID=UPI00047540C3|nr:hypothetical protein [Parafrankia elaeagni]